MYFIPTLSVGRIDRDTYGKKIHGIYCNNWAVWLWFKTTIVPPPPPATTHSLESEPATAVDSQVYCSSKHLFQYVSSVHFFFNFTHEYFRTEVSRKKGVYVYFRDTLQNISIWLSVHEGWTEFALHSGLHVHHFATFSLGFRYYLHDISTSFVALRMYKYICIYICMYTNMSCWNIHMQRLLNLTSQVCWVEICAACMPRGKSIHNHWIVLCCSHGNKKNKNMWFHIHISLPWNIVLKK